MNLFIKDYHGHARLFKVVRGTVDADFPHEQLIIGKENISFKSDGYVLQELQAESVSEMETGDIFSLNDLGILHRIYSEEEKDATIYMTGHCNSNCIMCPVSERERRDDGGLPDDWLKELLEMLPADLDHIVVTGGEPTLRLKMFLYVMHRMAERYPRIETLLLSNGRSFASQAFVKDLVGFCPQHLCVAVPLHGDTAELHDRITRSPGSFHQTLLGLRHLMSEGIAIELRIVVTKLNCARMSKMAGLLCNQFPGVHIVNFIALETRGNCALHFKETYLSHSEAFEYIKPAIQILLQQGIDVGLYNFPLCSVAHGYWGICRKSITPEKIRYPKACEQCSVKHACGGFFNTTLSMAHPQVYPVLVQEKAPC